LTQIKKIKERVLTTEGTESTERRKEFSHKEYRGAQRRPS
jgi:hypothetical protein